MTGVESINGEASAGSPLWPTTTTTSAAVQFRGGCVRRHPQVHDFTITAVVNCPIVTDVGDTVVDPGAIDALLRQLASMVGHHMLWCNVDAEELRRPVQWPVGVAGPRLPLLHWQVRPTAENVAMWIAGWLSAQIETISEKATLVALELRESPHLATVVRGVDIEACKGFPGLQGHS